MAGFDSQAVRELVDRAQSPMDSGAMRSELEGALADNQLSSRDRGRLLVSLAVVAQGEASPQDLVDWLDEATPLLRSADVGEVLLASLGMSAAIHASMGNVRACLDRCLDLLAVAGESGEPITGRAALNFGVALLALGAYPIAGDHLERAVRDALEGDDNNRNTMIVVGCLNLVFVIMGADIVGALPASSDVQTKRIALIREAVDEVTAAHDATEMLAFAQAVLALCAQTEGDLEVASEAWGDLDALEGTWSEVFGRYLAMVEAPIALYRDDLDRAEALVDRSLSGEEDRSMVPYRRLRGLRLRAEVHQRRGSYDEAIADLQMATDVAAKQASQLPDALIRQIGDRAELEQIRRGLLDNTSRLAELVLVDELSGTGNRRGFELCLDQLRESNNNVALIMLDLDNFKEINDNNGHTTGDRVISVAGRIISQALRPTDQIFRYGGDEFVVVPSVQSLPVAHAIAHRIQAGFDNEDWREHGLPQGVTVSIGLATGRARDADDVFADADVQLYAAKQAGRNAIRPVPEPRAAGDDLRSVAS